jgi:curved DNA-binding protein
MQYVDYYAALGVPRDADLAAIKKAYRTLARQHHPDVSKVAGSEEKFKNAALAYATLKNPEKRALYDQLEHQRDGAETAQPGQGFHGFDFGQDMPDFEGMDLSDLLDAMGRGHSMEGKRKPSGPRRGRDRESTVELSLEQAALGCSVGLSLSAVGGTRDIEVRIPGGVHAGQRVRLRGQADPGIDGGLPGDLYLHVQFAPHPRFRADGLDLYFDLALSPWEAALGTEVSVTTLSGDVVLTVPPGTSSGKRLRLRGRGMPRGADAHSIHGDMYALVRIAVPANPSAQERALWEQLALQSSFAPRQPSQGPTP